MTIRWILSILLALSFLSPLVFANRDEGMTPADGFFLPDGDPSAGQLAFNRMKCSSCHWVQNELSLTDPVAEKVGPILGSKQSQYAPGWIANSIVSPSHTIAEGSDGESFDGELSRMGDFTQTMTVRELIDIVAYIRSLKGNEKGDAS
jgi:L-cysteine S-thiosulfotransferase